jgi:hypothetical protein
MIGSDNLTLPDEAIQKIKAHRPDPETLKKFFSCIGEVQQIDLEKDKFAVIPIKALRMVANLPMEQREKIAFRLIDLMLLYPDYFKWARRTDQVKTDRLQNKIHEFEEIR